MKHTLTKLKDHSNILLPAIHKIWPSLITKLRDVNKIMLRSSSARPLLGSGSDKASPLSGGGGRFSGGGMRSSASLLALDESSYSGPSIREIQKSQKKASSTHESMVNSSGTNMDYNDTSELKISRRMLNVLPHLLVLLLYIHIV